MKSKIKVSTEKLLDAVRSRRAAMAREHEKACATYERDAEKVRGHVVVALRAAADAVEGGGPLPKQNGYRAKELTVGFRRTIPTKPTLDTYSIDQAIATLEIAAEQSVSITADDFARYMR